ncbi:hypothetical protein CI41S_19300 [Bradyrhizobium ivorense]|nr:hypothetical protein CI41S_19300 [Bradyrhizobium ivorense]
MANLLLGRGMGQALDGLDVARKQVAGLIKVARSQRLQNHAVILVGARAPAGTVCRGEHQSRICKLQSVETGEQSRHGTGCHQRVVKGAIGSLEILNGLGVICFIQCYLDLCQMGRRQLWRGVSQRDQFERRAHLGDLLHRVCIERCNPDATAGQTDDEVFSFELPKRLAHRDVARVEFTRDMVLSQWSVW